jgi:hypothetical protein
MNSILAPVLKQASLATPKAHLFQIKHGTDDIRGHLADRPKAPIKDF